jgi:predicted nucleic-acid-binding Zn-ribbon protein
MKAEGECPRCGARLGVKVADDGIPIPESTIKRLMDKDGNGMYCQTCDGYHDPDNIEVN